MDFLRLAKRVIVRVCCSKNWIGRHKNKSMKACIVVIQARDGNGLGQGNVRLDQWAELPGLGDGWDVKEGRERTMLRLTSVLLE